jgi:thiosulfate reductase cytochrome b subunit
MANLDLRLVFGYLTAQFILVGWMTGQENLAVHIFGAILLVNTLLFSVIVLLIVRHGRRRHQVSQTSRNIDSALRLYEPGFYFEGQIKNPDRQRETNPLLLYWHPIYIFICSVAFAGVSLLTFFVYLA